MYMVKFRFLALSAAMMILPLSNAGARSEFSMAQVLSYPFAAELAAAEHGDVIAWVCNLDGVRNVWMARAPSFTPTQVTQYRDDDGQEITQLTFSPDGTRLVFVLGGDHDANWPAEGNLSPDPGSSPQQPVTAIWAVPLNGGAPVKIDEGDEPIISARGQIAYTKDAHVWAASLDGSSKAERLFFDRGKDGGLAWSPDGSRLAFVSDRGDHSFIGIFSSKTTPLTYLAPSTSNDISPVWSPDGNRIAFARRPGDGGPPRPVLTRAPRPWAIWVASASDGIGHAVWKSPNTLAGSFPDIAGEANLHWGAGDRIVFMAYLDDWPHLYSVAAAGGAPVLLTPGAFMVEHVAESRDRRYMIYDANTGTTAGDDDRRHLFRVPVDHPGAVALTSGETLEWTPVAAAAERIAFIAASPQQPPTVAMAALDGSHRMTLAAAANSEFPVARLIAPKQVTFKAADGTLVHGQLFDTSAKGGEKKPAVIFVHGGPPRQMLLGWHYMDYYSNGYAVNQYLAAHGFVVLSVNYRLGIGYGRAFHHPEHAGYAGASEYQDVVAGARFLQSLPTVDGKRLGIWGGSYGGYLTALALARNSDIFKSGVDLHGVHDWSRLMDELTGRQVTRYEKGDRDKATEVAWEASPDAQIENWKSPVLLIQGDDDRNVRFQQTVDLARRLEAHDVPFEELVLPNEIHGFLRHASWVRADEATARFLARTLGVAGEQP
jgi:dipeptidyl aminopeptidase/acylaminoacyl peptidase